MPKAINMILVKTSKIVTFFQENHDFQEIEDTEKNKIQAKIDEKSHVFWNLDFKAILKGFWDGFGRPKSLIFALFSTFVRCKI